MGDGRLKIRELAGALLPALALIWLLNASPANADGINVVVSIKPVHSLVAAVMVGVDTPHLLVKGAGSPHAFALKPSDARALQNAQVVFWMGKGMETFLTGPIGSVATNAQIVSLAATPDIVLLPTREGGTWQHHDHDESNANDHPEEFDWHIWLDPQNAGAMVTAIVTQLSAIDTANQEIYRQNGAALTKRIDRLDKEIRAIIDTVRDKPFVVFHDAYQYFEAHYGIHAAGSITISPDIPPGAARLARMRDKVRTLNSVCVFSEPQFRPKAVAILTEGTGARAGVLDPLGANLAAGPDQYFELMRGLATSLRNCLSQ